MLGAAHRLRDSAEFAVTVRRGRRAAQPAIVAHVIPGTGGVTSVGFVVSKAVGPAVVRNRVKRQLRHVVRDRLDAVPDGSRVVVRALPAAAGTPWSSLVEQVDVALRRAGRQDR